MPIFKKRIIVIVGPTGVGKSDFAVELAFKVRGEIVNADLGQFYTPLTIGTAKPDLTETTVPHHLFNILDKPRNYTVQEYRCDLHEVLQGIWNRDNTPILVGGSTFYINALYYPPREFLSEKLSAERLEKIKNATWEDLFAIDPARAAEIDRSDMYRIHRALMIWYQTGQKPSRFRPLFDPIAFSHFILISRPREELNARINTRVKKMLGAGWLEEARSLLNTTWEAFVRDKGFIGYADIFDFLRGPQTAAEYEKLVAVIQQKTRQYAKRQMTYFRMLWRKLKAEVHIDFSRG